MILVLSFLCLAWEWPGIKKGTGKKREWQWPGPDPGLRDGAAAAYQIYYLNSTRTGLASVSYQTETADAEILIGELAGQILCGTGKPGVSGSF